MRFRARCCRIPFSKEAKHMKRIPSVTVLAFSIFAITSAFAADGYLTGDVNLRAGPDSSYPSVAMLGAGTSVAIQGCVDGWSWCDVAAGNNRGWVAGNFLQEEYQGQRVLVPNYGLQIGIPIVAFAFGSYWDNHYRNRSWYHDRDRWSHVTPQYRPVAVYGGPHGNSYPSSHVSSHNAPHSESHSSYAPHNASADELRQSQAVAHSSSQIRPSNNPTPQHSVVTGTPVEATVRPAAHHASAPRTSVAKAAPARTDHSKAITEHKTVTAAGPARKQAPKSDPKKEGDKDKDQR
jgi:uncharacterized protein YraI